MDSLRHRPCAFHVTHWSDDPFSRGAYSTLLPGATPEHRLRLGEPLDSKLVIAGEACNPVAPAMTHGAWNDGLRAAQVAIASGAQRVLVIGAGFAGIAAARHLHDAGIDCVVLEARDRVGGRVHSVALGPVRVDEGAAWLQHFDDNPLAAFAQQLGLPLRETDFSQPLAAAADGPLPNIDAAWESLRVGIDRRLPLADGVARYLDDKDDATRRATRFALEANLILEACLPLESLSVDALDEEGVGAGDRFLPQGYSQLAEHLAQGLDIRFNQTVTDIDWSGEQVRIGDESADFCICTVPIGVLREIDFHPPLPAEQQDALDHLAMGRLEKVVLQFEERWWPVSPSGYLRWYDTPASFGEWLDLTDGVGTPTVAGLIAADALERVFTGRSDEEIATHACMALQAWADAVAGKNL
ncbi:monoamine oxidase [Pseudomonas nitritireducens]|uniref:Tryptophan 2-monooxygenase n=1 Tax=Pseudomonas nitroreducens TaxID=46680 RepID=A0A7W7KIP6_PSENT|nr:NAD(P)/FAD-dependent oxidoreductase [Pseudomonas nitritireducens]MBB4863235.1 monoamine oxidase [Pseudomonas nitritireducens]